MPEQEDTLPRAFKRLSKDLIGYSNAIGAIAVRCGVGKAAESDVSDGLGGFAVECPINAENVASVEKAGQLAVAVGQEATGPDDPGHDLEPVFHRVTLVIDRRAFRKLQCVARQSALLFGIVRAKRYHEDPRPNCWRRKRRPVWPSRPLVRIPARFTGVNLRG